MATRKGLEPSTSGVTGRRSNQLNYRAIWCWAKFYGGNNRARTCDIMLVRHALSQLSYAPLLAALVSDGEGYYTNVFPICQYKKVKICFFFLTWERTGRKTGDMALWIECSGRKNRSCGGGKSWPAKIVQDYG